MSVTLYKSKKTDLETNKWELPVKYYEQRDISDNENINVDFSVNYSS